MAAERQTARHFEHEEARIAEHDAHVDSVEAGVDRPRVEVEAVDPQCATRAHGPGRRRERRLLLEHAGQQKVDSVAALEDRIAEAKEAGRKSLLLLVRRGGDPRFVALAIED
jgi:serine protease Do